MGTIQEWQFLPVIILRYSLICQKHKVFDDLGSHISIIWFDLYWLSFFIQQDLTLSKIKINGATLFTILPKDCCQLFHLLKHRHQLLIFFCLFFIMICQNPCYTGISHSAIDTDHALHNPMSYYLTFCIHIHQAAQSQPVYSLIQRTHTIGKCMWQHRYHSIHQIYTGSPL